MTDLISMMNDTLKAVDKATNEEEHKMAIKSGTFQAMLFELASAIGSYNSVEDIRERTKDILTTYQNRP